MTPSRRETILSLMLLLILAGAYGVVKYSNTQQTHTQVTDSTRTPETTQTTDAANNSATPIASPTLTILPDRIIQGDPVIIRFTGTTSIESATLDGKPLSFQTYSPGPATTIDATRTTTHIALYGLDIKAKVGTSTVIVKLADGRKLERNFITHTRPKFTESLPIPDQVGGNSTENQARILTLVDRENEQITAVSSDRAKSYWSQSFIHPVRGDIFITDHYGYIRDSGQNLLTHKGADYRAKVGTPIYAMNSGTVRIATTYTIYGNTVIIDHGFGLHTIYMHLDSMDVRVGDVVERGQQIGLSGSTGYSSGPHLHLSIKINGISIDPVKFMEVLGETKN